MFAHDSALEGSGFEPPVPQMHLVEQLFGAGINQVLGGPMWGSRAPIAFGSKTLRCSPM